MSPIAHKNLLISIFRFSGVKEIARCQAVNKLWRSILWPQSDDEKMRVSEAIFSKQHIEATVKLAFNFGEYIASDADGNVVVGIWIVSPLRILRPFLKTVTDAPLHVLLNDDGTYKDTGDKVRYTYKQCSFLLTCDKSLGTQPKGELSFREALKQKIMASIAADRIAQSDIDNAKKMASKKS